MATEVQLGGRSRSHTAASASISWAVPEATTYDQPASTIATPPISLGRRLRSAPPSARAAVQLRPSPSRRPQQPQRAPQTCAQPAPQECGIASTTPRLPPRAVPLGEGVWQAASPVAKHLEPQLSVDTPKPSLPLARVSERTRAVANAQAAHSTRFVEREPVWVGGKHSPSSRCATSSNTVRSSDLKKRIPHSSVPLSFDSSSARAWPAAAALGSARPAEAVDRSPRFNGQPSPEAVASECKQADSRSASSSASSSSASSPVTVPNFMSVKQQPPFDPPRRLSLDLSFLTPSYRSSTGNSVDLSERPDVESRVPLTPTSVVLERIQEAAASAVPASEPDGGLLARIGSPSIVRHGTPACARAAEASCTNSSKASSPSTVAVRVIGKGLRRGSLSDELKELTISEMYATLAESNQVLLGGASWAIDASEIQLGRRLGAGAYGEVYVGEWRRSRVAVKRLLHSQRFDKDEREAGLEENNIPQFIAEMEMMSNLRHDHIVQFLGGCIEPSNLCIIFEYCPLSLHDLLKRRRGSLLPERNAVTIASHVAHGMYYLHSCHPPVLHLDLKSANVLLDRSGRAKVCDFGLAHLKREAFVHTARVGAPAWTAPEVLRGGNISEAADSYSYGMLLYELLSSQPPYANTVADRIIVGVITGMLPRPSIPIDIERPPQLVELMHECWQEIPERRPSFEVILDAIESFERSNDQ